jgi:topoisomerase IA-like protein
MIQVEMLRNTGVTAEGKVWLFKGERYELEDRTAAALIAARYAVPVTKHDEYEKAVTTTKETRKATPAKSAPRKAAPAKTAPSKTEPKTNK